ncbi:MAG: hypothetical protein ACI97A_000883 [Planctomycetota bacterium]|jgi:hypothetical protein
MLFPNRFTVLTSIASVSAIKLHMKRVALRKSALPNGEMVFEEVNLCVTELRLWLTITVIQVKWMVEFTAWD